MGAVSQGGWQGPPDNRPQPVELAKKPARSSVHLCTLVDGAGGVPIRNQVSPRGPE